MGGGLYSQGTPQWAVALEPKAHSNGVALGRLWQAHTVRWGIGKWGGKWANGGRAICPHAKKGHLPLHN